MLYGDQVLLADMLESNSALLTHPADTDMWHIFKVGQKENKTHVHKKKTKKTQRQRQS